MERAPARAERGLYGPIIGPWHDTGATGLPPTAAPDDVDDGPSGGGPGGGLRIDKWLWCTRFFKTRSVAQAAVEGGHVQVNGDRIKASRLVKVGDRLHDHARAGALRGRRLYRFRRAVDRPPKRGSIIVKPLKAKRLGPTSAS